MDCACTATVPAYSRHLRFIEIGNPDPGALYARRCGERDGSSSKDKPRPMSAHRQARSTLRVRLQCPLSGRHDSPARLTTLGSLCRPPHARTCRPRTLDSYPAIAPPDPATRLPNRALTAWRWHDVRDLGCTLFEGTGCSLLVMIRDIQLHRVPCRSVAERHCIRGVPAGQERRSPCAAPPEHNADRQREAQGLAMIKAAHVCLSQGGTAAVRRLAGKGSSFISERPSNGTAARRQLLSKGRVV